MKKYLDERTLISGTGIKTVHRKCIICGEEYSYKGGVNFFWKWTFDQIGRGDVVTSKDSKDRIEIWPNDCCKKHRTLKFAKKFLEDKIKEKKNG